MVKFQVLMLVALLHSVIAEYRYKIRVPPPKPPPPPRPPIPHFAGKPFPPSFMKNKWPLGPGSGHRLVPPLRSPHFQLQQPLQQHYFWNGPSLHNSRPQFQFNGPSLILPNTKLNQGFRAPVIKEQFLPSPPQPEFDYKPAPQPPVVAHIANAIDDDKGPIHTIPAPNLSPNKQQATLHHEIENLPGLQQSSLLQHEIQHQSGLQHPSLLQHEVQQQPGLQHPSVLQHEIQQQPALHQEILQQHEVLNQDILNQHIFHQSVQLPQTHVTVHQSHGYEVREPSNDHAGHNQNGVPTYFAPDPDPSLPAPKIPATTDPHSVPSNGKTPPDLHAPALQILDHGSNSLSSQELFHLLHSTQQQQQQQQQQQLVDSYGVPLQQPQLQQHFHQQQAALYPPSNFLKHAETPDFQTFNYEEQESAPSVTVVRKSPESTVTSYREQDPKTNSVADYNQEDKGAGAIRAPYFTTLPSREAAETLATLAAAGNINSNLANHIRNEEEEESQETEEEYVEEEEVEEEEEERGQEEERPPPPQISKPVQREPEQVRTRQRPQLQRRPEHQQSQENESHQEPTKTDGGFGARIRPKRNK